MPNYSKVQFIAWGIYTGPTYDDNQYRAIDYPGIGFVLGDRRLDILGQFLDIKARAAFTKLAIEAAYAEADQSADILKIFMAPEFLYRGAAGAYVFDLLNGWKGSGFSADMIPPPYDKEWPGLFGELRELVKDPKFQDWIFVFGSAVGAAFQCSGGRIILQRDGSPDYLANGWNLSLIQCGGNTEEQQEACYFTQKHLKSGIDFIKFNLDHPGPHVFADENTDHTTNPDRRILDRLMVDDPLPYEVGGSLFRFPHIRSADGKIVDFGLEICLDHVQEEPRGALQPDVTGRLALYGEAVDIQLVPSCGMSLYQSSLALKAKNGSKLYSYAFNCDGLCAYDSQNPNENSLGGHVQLWGGNAGEEQEPRQLVEIVDSMYGTPVGDSVDLSEIEIDPEILEVLGVDLHHISASQLWNSHTQFPIGGNSYRFMWPKGAGFIHTLDPQPLCPDTAPEKNARKIPDHEKLLEMVKDNLDAFRKHYTIYSVNLIEKQIFEENTDFYVDFDVELEAVLKYDTACQLPHVQGMLKGLGINALSTEDLDSILQTEPVRSALVRFVQPRMREMMKGNAELDASLAAGAMDIASENIKSFVDELEGLYIGQTATMYLSFRASFSGDGTPLSLMALACDGTVYDAGLLVPEPEGKMRSNGKAHFQDIITGAVKTVLNRGESGGVPLENLEVYHRIRARDYANTWTSNPVRGTKDLTKWNTKENPHVKNPPYVANPNGDCANYVSQAIHAGGIPMSSKEKSDPSHWFAGPNGCSLAWENCTALYTYFTENQYWVHSDFKQCNAGGIIFFKDKSGKRYHVAMCVRNDTVTRAYSAHTHDRLRQVYTVGVDSSAVECWVFRNSSAD